ncbi:Hypothetical protein FKW44_009234, partial [Caligus rogercresseyi]
MAHMEIYRERARTQLCRYPDFCIKGNTIRTQLRQQLNDTGTLLLSSTGPAGPPARRKARAPELHQEGVQTSSNTTPA